MTAAGLLLVDKPEGPTSHDVISIVRLASGLRRVGHTGTLDPFASGLLLLCLGWATRLAEYLTPLSKSYRGVIRLGQRTDTHDRTGAETDRNEGWRDLDEGAITRALESQIGTLEQLPPAYSAKKKAGQRAYAVARAGGAVELRPQSVTIANIELRSLELPDVAVEVECSSGTYIRAIARDLGEALGVGAHLAELRRTRIGPFSVDDAIVVERGTPREEIAARIIPPDAAVSGLPRVELDPELREALSHGQPVERPGDSARGPVAVFIQGALVAVAEQRDDRLWPRKVFPSAAGRPAGREPS